MTIGKTQIGMALIEKRYGGLGNPLVIYPRSERDKDPELGALSALAAGDVMPLSLEATIIPRFARVADMHAFAEELA